MIGKKKKGHPKYIASMSISDANYPLNTTRLITCPKQKALKNIIIKNLKYLISNECRKESNQNLSGLTETTHLTW